MTAQGPGGDVDINKVALLRVHSTRRHGKVERLRQIERIHAAVLQLQQGQYGQRVDVDRRDELAALADAVNTLADRLDDSRLILSRQAARDALTGLPNRLTLGERLNRSFVPGSDRRSHRDSLLFIDVDDFKVVNDTLARQGALGCRASAATCW